jgi:hypothetical protein
VKMPRRILSPACITEIAYPCAVMLALNHGGLPASQTTLLYCTTVEDLSRGAATARMVDTRGGWDRSTS